jgi:hypothetical protein
MDLAAPRDASGRAKYHRSDQRVGELGYYLLEVLGPGTLVGLCFSDRGGRRSTGIGGIGEIGGIGVTRGIGVRFGIGVICGIGMTSFVNFLRSAIVLNLSDAE